jgi:hypothetical protein
MALKLGELRKAIDDLKDASDGHSVHVRLDDPDHMLEFDCCVELLSIDTSNGLFVVKARIADISDDDDDIDDDDDDDDEDWDDDDIDDDDDLVSDLTDDQSTATPSTI